ncbi:hypothetical protein I316_07458 [Kwoniella heveanensis BCC8398]|uniref:Glycosyltransferase family 18 catalytic domain-containing protein n=1 Tax=Kwoniella heveanensis BCC8398 TaxID=1296120 RepID=A0A1B9GIL8_9TREE|nr:hypothetical protein I316_07458 [Kwoniella heveanensis BCC8398]
MPTGSNQPLRLSKPKAYRSSPPPEPSDGYVAPPPIPNISTSTNPASTVRRSQAPPIPPQTSLPAPQGQDIANSARDTSPVYAQRPLRSTWSPPKFLRRRLIFFGIILLTLLVIISRSRLPATLPTLPGFLPSNFLNRETRARTSPSEIEYPDSIDKIESASEREKAKIQVEHAVALQPYFAENPNWGGREHGRDDYKAYTERQLRKLAVCVATNTCRENQTSVVIYGHIFAHFHIYEGYMGGEGIWTHSLTETLEKYGYTILHARDDWPYMWYIHNQIPNMVKAVIAWRSGQYGGAADFMKTPWRPNGIPAWKYFVYNYFPDHYISTVGDAWNVHSELGYSNNQRNFTFLPYIVEKPPPTSYIPTEQRPYQVYILAKFVRYFYPGTQPAWEDTSVFATAKSILEKEFPGFEFVVGCKDDRNGEQQEKEPMSVPDGIRNLGIMTKDEFERQLASSRAMLGIGWPTLSPSPHVALSYGIPFISPVSESVPLPSNKDPETWAQSQHNTLKALDEPYVYHVYRGNATQLVDAIRKALSNPIPQFVLPYMTREYQERAVGEFMKTDWRAKAEAILENRKKGIETENGNAVIEFTM